MIKEGYVYIDSCGNPIWETFTEVSHEGEVCWLYLRIFDESTTTTSTTSTSTSSTSSTSTSSTSSTTSSSTSSSTTTSTTTEEPTTTTTSSTTTTTTTEGTTTTTTSTSSTTTTSTSSSTTTTTTTSAGTLDTQVAVNYGGETFMSGTTITAVDINSIAYSGTFPMTDGTFNGDNINVDTSYTIDVYVDRSGSSNPTFVLNSIRILIKDSVTGGSVFDVSPAGLTSTSPDIISFTTNALDPSVNKIVITGSVTP